MEKGAAGGPQASKGPAAGGEKPWKCRQVPQARVSQEPSLKTEPVGFSAADKSRTSTNFLSIDAAEIEMWGADKTWGVWGWNSTTRSEDMC